MRKEARRKHVNVLTIVLIIILVVIALLSILHFSNFFSPTGKSIADFFKNLFGTQSPKVEDISLKSTTVSSLSASESSVEALAAANGMRVLMPGEVAVYSSSETIQQNKDVVSVINIDGQELKFTDGKAFHSIVKSVNGSNVFVKESDNVEIINLNAGSENEIDSLLSSSKIVPVIISLNLPFNRFYETKQSADKIKDKKDKFNNAKSAIASAFSGKKKVRLKQDLLIIGAVSADIDADTYSSLKKNPNVKKISYDRPVKVVLDTSVSQINADDVWNFLDENGMPITGNGMEIAIVDTGVDYTHADLGGCFGEGCKVIGGYDFINNDNDPMDDYGHGTHVAATAAGNGVLKGVAPDAKIYAYKVLSASGSGSASQVIAGINRATDPNNDGSSDDHVDVGSMSLGADCGTAYSYDCGPDDDQSSAVDASTAAGVVWVIAAGNGGRSGLTTIGRIGSPGTSRTAITVAAACKPSQVGTYSKCTEEIASFSSRGPVIWNEIDLKKPDISAPGVLICAAEYDDAWSSSRCLDDKHVAISGTSMATPHMAGAAALVRQAYPYYSPELVKDLLKSTAKPFPNLTYNDQGAGLVDVLAAIPEGTNFPSKANPTNWQVSSNPTQKYSTSQQKFVVTPKDTSVSTLTININMSIPGVTLTSDKATLNVADLANASFNLTINVDNDVAKSGAYFGRIILIEDEVIKGSIPIYLTITPTIEVSPQSLDYGIDVPSASSWTSEEKVITVKNKRLDSSQTITLTSSLPEGVSLQAPSSVLVAAGSQQNISTSLYINNNSEVPLGVYYNTLFVSNSLSSFTVSTKFAKMYLLRVNNIDTEGYPPLISVRGDKVTFEWESPGDFYLDEPGNYDIIAEYDWNVVIFREEVLVEEAFTEVNFSRKDATLSVKTIPTSYNGSALFKDKGMRVWMLDGPGFFNFYMLLVSNESQMDLILSDYFSPFSNKYKYNILKMESQPKTNFHAFGIQFEGLSNNITQANTPSELKSVNLSLDTYNQSGKLIGIIYSKYLSSLSSVGGYTYTSNDSFWLSVPVRQTVYAYAPPSPQENFLFKYIDYTTQDYSSVYFSAEENPRRWYGYEKDGLLPQMENKQLFVGLGPTYWSAKMDNNALNISIKPYPTAYYSRKNVLLRQDYSYISYPEFGYNLLKNGAIVFSGNFSSFRGYEGESPFLYYKKPTIAFINLTSAGKYELRTAFNYFVKNITQKGQVSSFFNTSLEDPNPPAFKRFYQYLNNVRSEVYSPSGTNSFELEIDPIGGTVAGVEASYSQDGSTFTPVTVSSLGDNTYKFNLPSGLSFEDLTVRILAVDSSSNGLIYTFGAPASIVNISQQYSLSVNSVGPGIVTSTDDEINCGVCSQGCAPDCSILAQKVCDGNSYKTCGYYDADSCLDWSDTVSCLADETCSNGMCVPENLYSGLVSWWTMDMVSGNQLIDSRGLHNGTMYYNASIGNDEERGSVLKLDGIYDYVNIGAFDETENLNEFTVSYWVKAAVADDTTRYVFYKSSNMGMYRSPSEYYYFIVSNDTSTVVGGTALAPKDTNWHHVVAIYNGTNVFTYIDMNKSALTKFSGETKESTDIFTISSYYSTFNGSIDDFMFYNRALSETEIQQIYNLQSITEVSSLSPFLMLVESIKGFFQNLFNIGEDENLEGELMAAKPSCTDSDGGLNYILKGIATKGTTSKTDYCSSTSVLVEYYCSGNIKYVNYNCGSGKVCSDGACIASTCTNECSISGQKICDGNGYKTCGNYDADSCLEWSALTDCGEKSCVDGDCISTCNPESDTQFCTRLGKDCLFTGNDNCGEPRTVNCGTCDAGETCSNGVCVVEGGTDYTDKICNVDGSASSTKVKCGLGDVNMNEDSTDATFGDCQDGTNDNYMWIEDVFVDATKVLTTDTVAVKCDVKCFSSSTKYAIAYNNGSGWRNLDYGSCNAGGIESKTKTVNIDDIPGTHYFRCIEKWYYEFTGVEICDSNTYSDNDDMSVEVIDASSCENECSISGQKVCEGNGYKTCGDYDADSCLEWSSVINCLTGQICLDGTCVASGIYAGLVSWWKMDNVSGNQLIDSRGLHNGTMYYNASIGVDAERGSVLKLDGSYDYVNIGAFDETENLNEFTISYWVKAAVADDTSIRYVFYKSSNMYMYRSSSEYYYFIVSNDTSAVSRGTALYPKDTNWHHVVAIYNGTNVFTYIDMNKSALTKFSGETRETISSFTISYPFSTIAFNGSIDDFMFYNRALSENEVNQLYLNQSKGGGTICNNCTKLYPFGTAVTLNANTYSTFVGWSGACSGTGSCTVAMTSTKNVIATFT